MKLSTILLLVFANFISNSNFPTDNSTSAIPDLQNLKDAVMEANNRIGSDSIYLSNINMEYQPDQFLITDHLVIVNDLQVQTDLLSGNIEFAVNNSGHLELVDFDLKELESKIVNNGEISLKNCEFQEGKNLYKLINNNGAFNISNGRFLGSVDGEIYRDAVFSHAARIIL